MRDATVGKIQQPFHSCPSSSDTCIYPAHTTIGLCTSTVDRTDDVVCTLNNCTLPSTQQQIDSGDPETRAEIGFNILPPKYHDTENVTGFFQMSRIGSDWETRISTIRIPHQILGDDIVPDAIPTATASDIELFWCLQEYEQLEGPTGNISATPVSQQRLDKISTTDDGELYLTKAQSSGDEYWVHKSADDLMVYIPKYFALTLYMTPGGNVRGHHSDKFSGIIAYNSDVGVLVNNIAMSFTNWLRGPNTLANLNATTTPGRVVVQETYIRVRWPWALLPVFEASLAAILLIATMLQARKTKQTLLKSSTLGLLFHGIEGWTAVDTQRAISDLYKKKAVGGRAENPKAEEETVGMLEDIGKNMRVKLCNSKDEGLRFVRQL